MNVRSLLSAYLRRTIGYLRWDLPWTIRHTRDVVMARWRHTLKYDSFFAGAMFTLLHRYYVTNGCRFRIPRYLTTVAFRARFYSDVYEAEGRELVSEFIRADDHVIELGACIGVLSCITNQLLGPNRDKHVVVEANPWLIPEIYANAELNHSQFIVIAGAVASGRCALEFYIHPLIVGGSADRETSRRIRVPVYSLDSLENSFGVFNVLLLNIEGGELSVLREHRQLLGHYRLIIVELHDFIIGEEAVEECRGLLRSAGLELRRRIGTTEAWERAAGPVGGK